MSRQNPYPVHDGEVLIIMPPNAMLRSPSLAAHTLQACGRAAGFRVSVLYANLMLASTIGLKRYETIGEAQANALLGERLFAASAYGLPPLGYEPERMLDIGLTLGLPPEEVDPRLLPLLEPGLPLELAELKCVEAMVREWVDEVALAVAGQDFKVVGCSSSFQQTAASVALLKRIKRLRPQTVTIVGGANCEGEMAEGVASLNPAIDYVFSGESELSFPDFLGQVLAGRPPEERIICGQPCSDLNAIPTPDFSEYYEQLERYLPEVAAQKETIRLPYESSRGCWWGQKHHCTFCGVNGRRLRYREKSPDRIIGELKNLLDKHPSRRVDTADSIMPFSYFKTLIPRLGEELPSLRILYDQKSNLSLANVRALKKAGVDRLVPGVEALSTSLLERMNKGVSARQNIALLRYARSVRLSLHWILLWGFPGDQLAEYEQTLALLPLLRHLEPPIGINYIHIARCSPYFDHPGAYGLRNLRPWGGYAKVLPPEAELIKVAYYFTADYDSGSVGHPDIMLQIRREVEAWQAAWNFKVPLGGWEVLLRPKLEVARRSEDQFELCDTRGLPGTQRSYTLDRWQASAVLVARPLVPSAEIEWALDCKVGVELDGWYVPLATAKPELLEEFENESRRLIKLKV